MITERDVSPVPEALAPEHVIDRLRQNRAEAIQAILTAEEADTTARAARKQAKYLVKRYERLVQEYNGQLQLPMPGESDENVVSEC